MPLYPVYTHCGAHTSAQGRPLSRFADGCAGYSAGRFLGIARAVGRLPLRGFDEWVRNDVGEYFVQIFDATLANWIGEQPGVCSMARTCGHAGVMEYNGDVYSCDHFVFPEYKLGNIRTHTLVEMMFPSVSSVSEPISATASPASAASAAICLPATASVRKPLCHHRRRRAGTKLSLRGLP